MGRPKKQPISESEWENITKLYQAGNGLEKLAKMYHRRREVLRQGLIDRGVEIVKKHSSYKHVDWHEIKELYESGQSTIECAKVAGCSVDHCRKMLQKHGTVMRLNIDREAQTAKEWMQRKEISQASLARQAGVGQGDVSYYLKGRIGSDAITETLLDMGCPERLLGSGNRKAAKQIEGKHKQQPTLWNPWADGEILCPPGVSSNSILMCPF